MILLPIWTSVNRELDRVLQGSDRWTDNQVSWIYYYW